MTLYHFANCLALAYTPYYLTYKYTGLSEYGAFWKVGQASLMYILTQLAKMLFLATFFPMSDMEEEEGEHKFDFLNDFLRATVDIADLVIIVFPYRTENKIYFPQGWHLLGHVQSVWQGSCEGPCSWAWLGVRRVGLDQIGFPLGWCQGRGV